MQAAQTLQGLASNAGIDTCVTTPPGAHNFDFCTLAFQNSLPWLSWKLKLTPEPSSVRRPAAPREELAGPRRWPQRLSSPSCRLCRARAAPCCSGSPSWTRTSRGEVRWRTAIDLVRQPVWLLGALFLVGTFGFQALALYFGPLSVVQPVLVLELIFTLGLRVFLLHDGIASRTWSAALMICVGLAAFLVVASPSEGTDVPNAGQWIPAVSTRGLIVLVLLLLSRHGSPAVAPPSSGRPRPSCGPWTLRW